MIHATLTLIEKSNLKEEKTHYLKIEANKQKTIIHIAETTQKKIIELIPTIQTIKNYIEIQTHGGKREGSGRPMGWRKPQIETEKFKQWKTRLLEDITKYKNAKLIMLTFNDESITQLIEHEIKQQNENGQIQKTKIKNLKGCEKHNQIATKAIRLFLERWRKKYKVSVRHWLVTQPPQNEKENVHIHGIIWTDQNIEEIEKIWNYGFMWKSKNQQGEITEEISPNTINNLIKYISRTHATNEEYKSIILSSANNKD